MTGDLEKAEMRGILKIDEKWFIHYLISGIIPNSFAHVFDHIANCGSERTYVPSGSGRITVE